MSRKKAPSALRVVPSDTPPEFRLFTTIDVADRDGSGQGDPQSPFMSVEEAAGLLKVNTKSLYAAIKDGQLPCARRIGRTIRIHRKAFWRWAEGSS